MDELTARLAACYRRRVGLDERDGGRDDTAAVYVGRDVPRELLLAAGCRPVRLSGRPGDTALADDYCGSSIDAVARSQFAQILRGELAETRGLVISGDCEGSVRLFLYLRELNRLDHLAGLPQFTFLDVLHLPHLTSIRYTRDRLVELAATLRDWIGRFDDGALRSAIRAANQARQAGRAVSALRTHPDGPLLSGVEALHLTAAGLRSRPDAFVAVVDEAVARSASRRPREGLRVFLTGSAHDVDGGYRCIESRGAVVVGEDHDWGDLAWDGAVDESGDPFTALAHAYSRGAPAAAGYGITERVDLTVKLARNARAELVVAWLRAGDDAPAWDVAHQQAALAEHDIPLVALTAQPYAAQPAGDAADALDDAIAAARARV